MSLINKMLQDLDARKAQPATALPSEVRPAAPVGRELPMRQIAIGASVLVVAGALAAVFWLRSPGPASAPAVVVIAPKVVVPVPVVAPPVAVPVVAAPVVEKAVVEVATPVKAADQASGVFAAAAPEVAPDMAPVRIAAAPRVKKEPRLAPDGADEPRVRVATVPAPVVSGVRNSPVIGGRDMNSAQRAEAQYRTALGALEEGRMTAAFEALGQALTLNPRHDAARQSLVALLIEAGRNDEAMQQLQQGLAIDPAQPTMAMLLARMQIERGASGVATLMRTLPSASGNADYHAFLAGALQRESRHREAAEQYGAALRTMPEHGVWLMGLGISLQAEKRDREALAAFQRAKTSGTLTPQLLAFVELKVQQLAP